MNKNSLADNSIKLSHISPLDFKNAAKLPDSHTWTVPSDNSLPQQSISIIALDDPNAPSLIRQASEKWGMFQIINHGIPTSLMQQIIHQSQRFFALPPDQKNLALRPPTGITGYGLARISTFFDKQMWYEGFTIMGSPAQHVTQLWPDDYSLFCDVVEEYQKEMKKLSERVVGLMFKSLGLDQEDVQWFRPKSGSANNQQPHAVLQMNSYPKCPEPGRAMGLAPHTDSTLITLLQQSNANGLQVLAGGIEWVPVHPVDGAIVVNIGDLMHIISNGRFKSPKHRATVNETHDRISVAYFYGPPMDVEVSPLMKLVDSDHPKLYKAVSWKEYLDAKAKYFDKALDLIKDDAENGL